MSEMIDYYGIVRKFKEKDVKELRELISQFQDADVTICEMEITFSVPNGWRGGGLSCEEIVKEHFGEFCEKHPHIELEVIANYVEHSPSETITIKGKEVSINDNFC